MISRFVVFLFILISSGFASADAGKAGAVVFSAGDARLEREGKVMPVPPGTVLMEGDKLLTGANGHIHVRTSDEGFLSIRPESVATIEIYQFDKNHPENTRIRLLLTKGVMRSISGKGAQAAKQQFRLNTPVAAISIRGTDFSVFTSGEATRVSVREGGVAMSPFNSSCAAEALAPCQGSSVIALFSDKAQRILSLERGAAKPIILDRAMPHLLPEIVAPPLPEENHNSSTTKSDSSARESETSSKKMLRANASPGVDEGLVSPQIPEPEQSTSQALRSIPSAEVTPAAVLPQLHWGRWEKYAALTQQNTPPQDLLGDGKELVVANAMFGLIRDRSPIATPERGRFDFRVAAHESYLLNGSGQVLSGATVDSAKLSIDFAQHWFETRFNFSAPLLPQAVSFHAVGSVNGDGRMYSEFFKSNFNVRGALSNDGKEAAYLYDRRLTDSLTASGLIHWQR